MTQEFFDPLQRSLSLLADFLPRLFALIAVLVLGLLVAWLLRLLVLWLLGALRLDDWGRRLGMTQVFGALRVQRPLRVLLADIFYALVLVLFLVVGLDALDPGTTGSLISSFYSFLPRILVALLILFTGYVVSLFVAQWTLVAAVNAQWRAARPLATGTQFLVLTLALAMALEQVGIAQGIVVAAFALSFGGIVLALALAFGIGGADIARRTLETRLGPPRTEDRPDEFSHI